MTISTDAATIEQLRAAARLLEERAWDAADGPWTCSPVWSPDSTSTSAVYSSAYPTGTVESEVVGGCRKGRGNGGIRHPHNAVYIATMQPSVALAQAELLDMVAVAIKHDVADASVIRTALAVARAVLGETDDTAKKG